MIEGFLFDYSTVSKSIIYEVHFHTDHLILANQNRCKAAPILWGALVQCCINKNNGVIIRKFQRYS